MQVLEGLLLGDHREEKNYGFMFKFIMLSWVSLIL